VGAQWNGEKAWAARGTAIVADSESFPRYWAKTEGIVGERIRVVRVFYPEPRRECAFDLDDRDGSGWAKVTAGGSPRAGHRNVEVVPGSFEPDSWQDLWDIVIERELGAARSAPATTTEK